MTPTLNDLTVDEVLECWRNHKLAGVDVTDWDHDDNAFWRSRAFTVEDAIAFLRAKQDGDDTQFEWFDFGDRGLTRRQQDWAMLRMEHEAARKGYLDVILDHEAQNEFRAVLALRLREDQELAAHAKELIPDYEEELKRREELAAEEYRQGGDMVI